MRVFIGFALGEAAEQIASCLPTKLELSHPAAGDTTYAATLESSLTVLYKTKHKSTFDPSSSLLNCNPKMKAYVDRKTSA